MRRSSVAKPLLASSGPRLPSRLRKARCACLHLTLRCRLMLWDPQHRYESVLHRKEVNSMKISKIQTYERLSCRIQASARRLTLLLPPGNRRELRAPRTISHFMRDVNRSARFDCAPKHCSGCAVPLALHCPTRIMWRGPLWGRRVLRVLCLNLHRCGLSRAETLG